MKKCILLAVLLSGCSAQAHKAKVICHDYEETANDGSVARNIETTIEVIDTGHRMVWNNNYGQTGDVFTVYHYQGLWLDSP